MEIIYSSKARQDLAKIDWKIRNSIIQHLSTIKSTKESKFLVIKPITNTDFHKIDFKDYIAISKIETKNLNILTVVEKKEIRVPE